MFPWQRGETSKKSKGEKEKTKNKNNEKERGGENGGRNQENKIK